jgi:hypothetical protein
MNIDEASNAVRLGIEVTREDIARAKEWLLDASSGDTEHLIDEWLAEQNMTISQNSKVDFTRDDISEQIAWYSRVFSVRLAFYQAQWELIGAGEMILAGNHGVWSASLGFKYSNHSGGLNLQGIRCSFPSDVMRPPLAPEPSIETDIFLKGINCVTLHTGILEAIKQSLACFRRGLYMPAIAMLAAAAEATWTECGIAVAKKLTNLKLDSTVLDPFASIGKKVAEIQKAFQTPDGKLLLKSAGRSFVDLDNVELWTSNLRERRNALHWDKAKSFIADHSDTASLLMGAPLHIGTLEAIRASC